MTIEAVVVPASQGPQAEPGAYLASGRMSRADARRLTDEIRGTANRLWMLVAIAYDRSAWRALGYDSWKRYVVEELEISESRSYQLIDTGRVMLAIAETLGRDPAGLDPVPARAVAKVKDALPALRRALAEGLAAAPDADSRVLVHDALSAVIVPEPRREPLDVASSGQVTCPLCLGGGDLGSGDEAEELAARAQNWLTRYVGR